jgi:hypothetical protein
MYPVPYRDLYLNALVTSNFSLSLYSIPAYLAAITLAFHPPGTSFIEKSSGKQRGKSLALVVRGNDKCSFDQGTIYKTPELH